MTSWRTVPNLPCHYVTDDRCMLPVSMRRGRDGQILVLDYSYSRDTGLSGRLRSFSSRGTRGKDSAITGVRSFRSFPDEESESFLPSSFTVDRRNRIYLVGTSFRTDSDSEAVLVRLGGRGFRDPTFGAEGRSILPLAGIQEGRSMAFANRRLILAGIHNGQYCAVTVVIRVRFQPGSGQPAQAPLEVRRCDE